MGILIAAVVIGSVIRALGRGTGGRYVRNRYAHKMLSRSLRRR